VAPLRKAVAAAEREVKRLTVELEKTQQTLADPGLYDSDGDQVAELAAREGSLKKQLAQAETAWLEAQEALEQAEPVGTAET